ncbi:MAG TPA: histidine kinase, partial [Blastocatellia bacterium]|nr:histidine kinase [Blastocatellia bacterium]
PLERGRWLRNSLIHAACCIALSVGHRAIYLILGWTLHVIAYERLSTIYRVYHLLFLFNLPPGFMSYGAILLASYMLVYYRRYQQEELKASQLQTRLAQAELAATTAELRALRMQLQPHFLFNTLNSISALLEDDPVAADEMLSRLGDLLRRTIEGSGAQTVTLEEELDFLKSYLDIERVRFADRLVVETEVAPGSLKAIVPTFILQPIVENAIKYAIAPAAGRGAISITSREKDGMLDIEVSDSGALISRQAAGAGDTMKEGLGLSNTRARLNQMYGGHHRLDVAMNADGGLRVTIQIPFVVAGQNADHFQSPALVPSVVS